MDEKTLKENFGSYKYLVDKFTKERIRSRYDWLESMLQEFIKQEEYEDKVLLSHDLLNHVIVDYFVDIDRLKEFQEIEKVHPSKIYAYLCFWLLRRKPLQVSQTDGVEELAFVNESFACVFIRAYLFAEFSEVSILDNKKEQVDNFVKLMLYFFKYRDYSAKNIELMILAFQAGCGYQYSADHQ